MHGQKNIKCNRNVQSNRPQMTIWGMRIVCWIPKATHTYSDHITLIAFPQQQWLHKRVSMSVFLLRPSDLGTCHIFRSKSLQACVSSTTMSIKYAVSLNLLTFPPPLKKLVGISCIIVGGINLPQKHCCATIFLYSWQWHVTQQHTQNALLYFHRNVVMRNSHNVTLHVHRLIYCVLEVNIHTYINIYLFYIRLYTTIGRFRDRFPVVSLGIFPWFPPTEPCALRLTQPLKVGTRDIYWGEGGRCVWLTTYHPCSAETSK